MAAEYESDVDTKCDWCSWNGSERLRKKTGRVGNRGTNRDFLDYSQLLRSARIPR